MKQIKKIFWIIPLFILISCGGIEKTSEEQQNSGDTIEQQNDNIEPFSKVIGTQQKELSHGIVIDSRGYVYLCGTSEGNLTSKSNTTHENFFIQKLSPSGESIWTKQYSQIDTKLQTEVTGLSIDKNDNIYIGGNFIDFSDPDHSTYGVFVTKYNNSGTMIWFKKIIDNEATLDVIKIGKDENIYLSGHKNYWQINEHQTSMFITQYSPDGEKIREKEFAKIDLDGGYHKVNDINFDPQNNIYVTGRYITKPFEYPNGDSDLFITKFSSALKQTWIKILGSQDEIAENTSSAEEISSIKIVDNYIYAVGTTLGNFDEQHSNKQMSLYSRYGIFLKFDTEGTEISRRQFNLNNKNTLPVKLIVDKSKTLSCMVLNGEMNLYNENGKVTDNTMALHKLTFNNSGEIVEDITLMSDSNDVYYWHNLDAAYTSDGALVTTSEKNKGGHFNIYVNPPKDNRDLDVQIIRY